MSIQPIDPAAIPQVEGDIAALSQSAQSKRRCAEALIQRGLDVHAAWQGLAWHYQAPEAAALYVAMAPVRDLAGRVGQNEREVAAALDHYAGDAGDQTNTT